MLVVDSRETRKIYNGIRDPMTGRFKKVELK